jgi:hypothetical protein
VTFFPRSLLLAFASVLVHAALPGPLHAGPETRTAVPAQPLFSRHVVPVFSRLGCNAGSCHGAVQGQNGFRLTLFGADPALDHARLLREFGGRRLNLTEPDASLLLLKAAGRVPHQGGKQTDVDAPEYQILRTWIAQGARLDTGEGAKLKNLRVTPAQQTVGPRDEYQLRVEAAFADGTTEDVTGLCTFDSTIKEVAVVDRTGRVTARGVGDAALVVRFRAEPVVAAVIIRGEAKNVFPGTPGQNFIDRHIQDKLRLLNIQPSPLCDDATFLRRVSLDLAGELPTSEEVRKLLSDPAPDKRVKKVDELLARPGHATLWASKFCDILKPTGFNANDKLIEPVEARRFNLWLRDRIQEGTPFDQLVERILTATSREGRPVEAWVEEIRLLAEEAADPAKPLEVYSRRKTLDLYWQKSKGNSDGGNAPVKAALQVSHAFLGLRLECAQCHRHPHDVWQQNDLLDFANFFGRVSSGGNNGSTPEARKDTKTLTEEAKQKRTEAQKLNDRIGKEKNLPKEEADKLKEQANALSIRARALETMAGRLGSTEIHSGGKGTTVSTRSPLGQQTSTTFRLLGENKPITVPEGTDPRTVVMAWMRSPNNPYFTKAIVNRVWAHYFGRGLVDPPDHLSPLNPASHPELLDELCAGFIKSNYDLKWLHRTIATSRTYQLSSASNPTNRADTRNYARFYLRRLSAEMVIDAINHATGGSETFPGELRMSAGARAMDLAGDTKVEARDVKFSALAYALQVFGRPARSPDVQCDCERGNNASIVQTLYLVNHPAVREKISNPQGRIAQIVKDHADDARRIEESFLWVLGRLPSPEERDKASQFLKASASPQKGVEGLFRTLLLSDEFILNH